MINLTHTRRDLVHGDVVETIAMESDCETMEDFVELVRRFSLAIGYQPGTVEEYLGERDE